MDLNYIITYLGILAFAMCIATFIVMTYLYLSQVIREKKNNKKK